MDKFSLSLFVQKNTHKSCHQKFARGARRDFYQGRIMNELTSLEEIREIIGEPNPLASKKIYTKLNSRMQVFIQTSPLVMLSTVDEFGFPTISPKGDKAGFVQVSDEHTLLLPELRGNKLAFSLTNIIETSNKVGLIFLRPGTV